jgi:hypothetical protein
LLSYKIRMADNKPDFREEAYILEKMELSEN